LTLGTFMAESAWISRRTAFLLLRITAIASASLFLYSALFLYEDEEKQLQNRLEAIWISLTALETTTLGWQVAFLKRISSVADRALKRLYGPSTMSRQTILVSVLLAVGSLFLSGYLFSDVPTRLIWPAMFFLVFAAVPALTSKPVVVKVWNLLAVPLLLAVLPYVGYPRHAQTIARFFGEFAGLAAGVTAGAIVSVFLAAINQHFLGRIADAPHLAYMAGGIVFEALLSAGIVFVIFIGAFTEFWGHSRILAPVFWAASCNLASALISLLLTVLIFAALVHRLLWPIVKRPVYALGRYGIASPKFKTLLAIASGLLLTAAFPNSKLVLSLTKLLK